MSDTHETTNETTWPVLVQTPDGLDYAWPWELAAHRRVFAVVLRRAAGALCKKLNADCLPFFPLDCE